MKTNKLTTLFLCLGLATTLTACEMESEKDMLADAQFCLDEATDASSAQACMSKISGLNSAQANTLRCATGFISAGITQPAKLSEALNALSENGSTATVLSVLSFDDLTGAYGANKTFEYCNASNSAGLSLLGAMSKSASVIGNLTSGSGSLETQFQTAINDILTDLANAGDPTAQAAAIANAAAIGGSIVTVYNTTCGGNMTAMADICGSINSALDQVPGGADLVNMTEAEIGEALLDYWKDLNH